MYEHNALGYWSGLVLCLTKVTSSRARCPATALICICIVPSWADQLLPQFSKNNSETLQIQWRHVWHLHEVG